MHCILHIGIEKTGTTAIQRFLEWNRDALRRSGCLVPWLTGPGGHSSLCVACSDEFRNDDLCRYARVPDEASWREHRHESSGILRHEINEARAQGAQRMVISSEHIQSRLTSPTELAFLKSFLIASGVTTIQVIVYLRDPAGIAGALYSTSVKYGTTDTDAPGPDDPYYRNVCDHRGTIERFAAVFGVDAIVPRLFEPGALPAGSVIDDFVKTAGLTCSETLRRPATENPSLSRTGIRVLQRINASIPVFLNGSLNPARQRVLEILEDQFRHPPYRLSAEMRSRYDEAFAASNEWVRARFYGDRRSLFTRDHAVVDAEETGWEDSEIDRVAAEIVRDITAAG